VKVAGVDGCRGGWMCALAGSNGSFELTVRPTFAEVLGLDAAVVGIDIQIGLPDDSPRPADAAARKFVGPRRSSVFPTPPRPVLEAATYAEACDRARALTGRAISKQAYAIRHRILEVDVLAGADERVIEVHPEVSFRALAGRPLASKHTSEGRRERLELVTQCYLGFPEVPRSLLGDALDAAVVAWTAARYARGEARSLPEGGERIGSIWY
jgi:predicted RNase H-like nuclease